MHLLDGVVAGLVLLELHAPAVELLDGGKAVLRIGVHAGLIDDAVIGQRDLARVLLGRGVAGNDRVVQPIHAHRDGATALDVCLVDQQHAQRGVALFCLDRRHWAGGAAAHDDEVVLQFLRVHTVPCEGKMVCADAATCRSSRSRYWKVSPRK